MVRLVDLGPIQLRTRECLRILRVRHVDWVPAQLREFLSPAVRNLTRSGGIREIDEVEERRTCTPLLALEQHRDERRGHHQGRSDFQKVCAHEIAAALATGTIADLVVVLQVAEEPIAREAASGASVPAPPERGIPSVVYEGFAQRLGKIRDRPEVFVVSVSLAGENGVQS